MLVSHESAHDTHRPLKPYLIISTCSTYDACLRKVFVASLGLTRYLSLHSKSTSAAASQFLTEVIRLSHVSVSVLNPFLDHIGKRGSQLEEHAEQVQHGPHAEVAVPEIPKTVQPNAHGVAHQSDGRFFSRFRQREIRSRFFSPTTIGFCSQSLPCFSNHWTHSTA